jgi:hypothetical protein
VTGARLWAAAMFAAVLSLALSSGAAPDASDDALFSEATADLEKGAWDDAIDRFELLADRGFVHPDASYDRGLAYIRRAQGRGARPGDLGRAAAALTETLLSRPDDADARFALERVREEIARRRARAHAREIEQRPSLGWAVVGLATEDTWALLAAAGSLVLALSLIVGFSSKRRETRLAAIVAGGFSATLLVTTASLAGIARHDRLHSELAVVIADEAHLSTDSGASISGPGSVVPEGAEVRIVTADRRGSLAHVEWGTLDGWLSLGELRLLARP